MTENYYNSKNLAILARLSGIIFIEVLNDDKSHVNLYACAFYKSKNIQQKEVTPISTISEFFITKIAINDLGDALNNSGKVSKITLLFPNIGFCRNMFYQLVEIINDSGINFELFFNFKVNNNYLQYSFDKLMNIVSISNLHKLEANNTDYKIRNIKCEGINFLIKRFVDITASLCAMFILSPIFLITALFIKFHGAKSVFYKPTRIGLHGKPFKMFKFKSMYDDDFSGLKSTIENDPRITPIGRFIRRHNIDELPQLYNVLKGDMSLVGPRPHRVFLSESLHSEIPNYSLRYLVKPGITGWAQANGWRGPTETEIQKRERTLHDIFYVGNWNIFFDIKIIIMTILGTKSKKNAF
ncbi:MAG: sugar transferase [Chitinophagales bacterium]|nr:sugar transferase [Chitinophagales bacterium]